MTCSEKTRYSSNDLLKRLLCSANFMVYSVRRNLIENRVYNKFQKLKSAHYVASFFQPLLCPFFIML